MKTIERRGPRSLFGKIILATFILWNGVMGWSLISFVQTSGSNPALKDLTPDNRNAALGMGIVFGCSFGR